MFQRDSPSLSNAWFRGVWASLKFLLSGVGTFGLPTLVSISEGELVSVAFGLSDAAGLCVRAVIANPVEGALGFAAAGDEIKGAVRAEIQISEVERLPCLLYTSPSPRDQRGSRMPSSA